MRFPGYPLNKNAEIKNFRDEYIRIPFKDNIKHLVRENTKRKLINKGPRTYDQYLHMHKGIDDT